MVAPISQTLLDEFTLRGCFRSLLVRGDWAMVAPISQTSLHDLNLRIVFVNKLTQNTNSAPGLDFPTVTVLVQCLSVDYASLNFSGGLFRWTVPCDWFPWTWLYLTIRPTNCWLNPFSFVWHCAPRKHLGCDCKITFLYSFCECALIMGL